ncbi:hypothetical protein EV178_002566 [Coemansia sp. RSA 1646]|nr:hypothetical protein EV178_002566 [Coemansia sp. RSA 1646]
MQDPAMDQIAQVLKNFIESQSARDIRQEERDIRQEERDRRQEERDITLRNTISNLVLSQEERDKRQEERDKKQEERDKRQEERDTELRNSISSFVWHQEARDRRQEERDTKHEAEFNELRQTNQEILTSLKNLNTVVPAVPRQGSFHHLQLGSLNDTESEISKIQSKFRDLYSKSTILEGDYYTNNQPKPMMTERHVQNAVYLLLLSVYETIATRNDKPRLRCCDTSASPLDDANKPDFVFVPADTDNPDWESACVAIELKAINRVGESALHGQIGHYFNQMWRLQPRKYCVGLVSHKDELHILFNTRDAITHAVVGKLPFVDSVRKCIYRSKENAHITFKEGNGELVVRTLAMLFDMSLEQCGFLVPQPGGVYRRFGLLVEKPSIDQAEAVLAAVAGNTPTANCLINLSIGGYLSGRVMFPVGTTSWVHKASVDVHPGKNSFQGNAVVKIQWRRGSRWTESSVYRVLHDMKIPNVPQVIFSGCIGMGTLRIESRCDVLVLEPCGVGIIQYVQQLAAGHETNHWMLLDVACGYIHTLYAAWSGTSYRVLHRDISSGNLMVSKNRARVIDWEYGLLFNINRRMEVNADPLTGTMIYASMAVLRSVAVRSPFDDIESLFYVLAHAIENAYSDHGKGGGKIQDKAAQRLWGGNLSAEELINERKAIFGSIIEYKKRLGDKCPPSWIVLLESMYNALSIGAQVTLSDTTFDIDFHECIRRLVKALQPFFQERQSASKHYTALLRFCNTISKRPAAA